MRLLNSTLQAESRPEGSLAQLKALLALVKQFPEFAADIVKCDNAFGVLSRHCGECMAKQASGSWDAGLSIMAELYCFVFSVFPQFDESELLHSVIRARAISLALRDGSQVDTLFDVPSEFHGIVADEPTNESTMHLDCSVFTGDFDREVLEWHDRDTEVADSIKLPGSSSGIWLGGSGAEMGLSDSELHFAEVEPFPKTKLRSVHCGNHCSFVLTSKGQVYGRGSNIYGRLGIDRAHWRRPGRRAKRNAAHARRRDGCLVPA